MATLTFHGAAQEVTGSCHMLESPAIGRILMDCGLHQGGDAVERVRDESFPFSPADIEAVILSHAHLDHCGLLPKLFHEGFTGPIICTRATAELLEIMLHDSVGLYLRDLEHANVRKARRGRPTEEPAFGMDDVEGVLQLCKGYAYGEQIPLGSSATLCFHDAGHILGSAIIEIEFTEKGKNKRLVFSGDLGKKDSALMNEPALLSQADVVLIESTYGDREHRGEQDTVAQLDEILKATWRKGGSVMIPAFAVGRTQDILFHLGCLHHDGELDNWQVFLDSPMAIAVTRVYDHWLRLLDANDVRELSDVYKTSLAGSGMCTGGRIRHHIKQRIWDDRNTLIFAGYQARGTLGRILVDGAQHIKMFGDEYIVKANIETLGGLSAHAGQSGLMEWLAAFENKPRTLLVHGEPQAQDALSQRIWKDLGMEVEIPQRGQSLII
jgi:metallo-beta-lactamase family protein